MSQSIDPKAKGEAIDWVIRLRESASADWAGFTAWLESAPGNAAAYDAVALADADMAEAAGRMQTPAELPLANDNEPGFFRRFGGFAAALLVVAAAYPTYTYLTPTWSVETALGEQRSVTLDDGTVIDLNGGTRVTLDKRNTRLATLEEGEARFTVIHDDAVPFSVKTGSALIQDVGTVFNVTRDGEQIEIAVAEGSVLYDPKRKAVLLVKGQVLRTRDGAPSPSVSDIDPATIGGWKSGRLSYDSASFSDVAPDLSRALGKPVSVAQGLGSRKFTGTIVVDNKDPKAMQRIAALMGVEARSGAGGWQLTAP